jgi:hypothetical protein
MSLHVCGGPRCVTAQVADDRLTRFCFRCRKHGMRQGLRRLPRHLPRWSTLPVRAGLADVDAPGQRDADGLGLGRHLGAGPRNHRQLQLPDPRLKREQSGDRCLTSAEALATAASHPVREQPE